MRKTKCPNHANHTELPSGYLPRQEVFEQLHKAGYKQKRCPSCSLYAIWHKHGEEPLGDFRDAPEIDEALVLCLCCPPTEISKEGASDADD